MASRSRASTKDADTTKDTDTTNADTNGNGAATTIAIPELPDPASLLDAQIAQAQANMDALKPAVDAFRAWEQFAGQLLDVKEGKVRRATPQHTRRTTTSTGTRAGRGNRPQEFLNVVKEAGDEGVTVTEAAAQMGMGPNYLYRIAPDMEATGQVKKVNKRYVWVSDTPTEGTDATGGAEAEGTEAQAA